LVNSFSVPIKNWPSPNNNSRPTTKNWNRRRRRSRTNCRNSCQYQTITKLIRI